MRYLVDPHKRRAANSWLYARIFDRVRANAKISIGSDTMDLTLHEAKEPTGAPQTPTPQPSLVPGQTPGRSGSTG
jgi:hypothetical protein